MSQAAQLDEVILQSGQGFFHVQAMKINLRTTHAASGLCCGSLQQACDIHAHVQAPISGAKSLHRVCNQQQTKSPQKAAEGGLCFRQETIAFRSLAFNPERGSILIAEGAHEMYHDVNHQ